LHFQSETRFGQRIPVEVSPQVARILAWVCACGQGCRRCFLWSSICTLQVLLLETTRGI